MTKPLKIDPQPVSPALRLATRPIGSYAQAALTLPAPSDSLSHTLSVFSTWQALPPSIPLGKLLLILLRLGSDSPSAVQPGLPGEYASFSVLPWQLSSTGLLQGGPNKSESNLPGYTSVL